MYVYAQVNTFEHFLKLDCIGKHLQVAMRAQSNTLWNKNNSTPTVPTAGSQPFPVRVGF